MARPQKRTVDYFPHYVNTGKTILILQNEFGNDGYAFWFKLLSLLCKTDGQVYDYNNSAAWRLLLAETHVSEDIANKVLSLLAEIDAIDKELYLGKIIWVQHLVDNLEDVYRRRAEGSIPEKPVIANKNPVNVNNNSQTKLNKTKLNKTKLNKTNNVHFQEFYKEYPKKEAKVDALKAFSSLNPSPELLQQIIANLKVRKQSPEWQKDGGKFIPLPATYLRGKRWEDEVTVLPNKVKPLSDHAQQVKEAIESGEN